MYYNEKMESDSSENDKRLINKSRYEEYDMKPIKPLDPKFLNKKLSEYPELSLQEIEELKRKTAQRTRAKTTEQPKVLQQKPHGKMPARQLSFNSSNSNSKINQSPKPSATSNSNAMPIKIRKRSKTQDDVRVNRVIKTSNIVVQNVSVSPSVNGKSKIKYNPDRYSPKINKTSVQPKVDSRRTQPQNNSLSPKKDAKNNMFLKNIGKKSLLISNMSDDEEFLEDQSSKFNSPVKSKTQQSKPNEKTPAKLIEKIEHTNSSKLLDESETAQVNISNKLSIKEQIQHMEIHTKIQKQRQEMRLQREKNLIEFKNLSKSQNNDPMKPTKDELSSAFVSKNITCNFFFKHRFDKRITVTAS
jgi:hypothetical protein